MGVETSPDTLVTTKHIEAPAKGEPASDQINLLGGQLLSSPEAAKLDSAAGPKVAFPDAAKPTPADTTKPTAADAAKPIDADAAKPIDGDAAKPTAADAAKPTAADAMTAAPAGPAKEARFEAEKAAGAAAEKRSDPEVQQKTYDQIHGQYEKDLKTYWNGVAAAKKDHHFVLEFPPLYTGPDKPKTPGHPPEVKPNTTPTINQMLDDSKHLNQFASGDKTQPNFELRQVSESEFKQRYAQEAVHIGQQHGVSKDNVKNIVRSIYAFEDGGWGSHETLSSMPPSLVKDDKPGETKIQDARRNFHLEGAGSSSALGYNQLMMANSMENIDQHAKPIADRLEQLAQENPARATELQAKAAMLTSLSRNLDKELMVMANAEKNKKPEDQKKYLGDDGKPTDKLYIDFDKSKELTSIGVTRQDIGRAVHALNLDGDIGPILQAQELGHLFDYADRYGYQSLLQGKEQSDKQALTAYDALPADQKAKAVSEVMDLVKSPVPTIVAPTAAAAAATAPKAGAAGAAGAVAGAASGTAADQAKEQEFNATKDALEKRFLAMQPGIDSALSKDSISVKEADMMRVNVLAIKDVGELSGPLSPQAQLLLNKVTQSYYGGLTADKLMPAVLELANLSGPTNAKQMADVKNQNVPTVNFFSQAGYQGNPVTNRRTGPELLLQIERSMKGPNNSASDRPGQADFDRAFAQL
jgi:hypothetical protein